MKVIKMLLFVMMMVLVSCVTTSVARDKSQDFVLPTGFDYMDKDIIYIELNKLTCSGLELSEETVARFNDILRNRLSGVKRFSIISDKKEGAYSKSGEIFVTITPSIVFKVASSFNNHTFGATATLPVMFTRKRTGIEEDAFTAKGTAWNKTSRLDSAEKDGIKETYAETYARKAFGLACNDLVRKLAKKFPLSSTVMGVQNQGKNTIMTLDRGALWGYANEDLYQIYEMKDGMATVAAIAYGLVGRENSTLTIIRWNDDNDYVKNELKPSILKNGLNGHDLRAVQKIH